MNKYWRDDEDDKANRIMNVGTPVVEPEDFSNAPETPAVVQPTASEAKVKVSTLEDLSEEELERELNRRKVARFDRQIMLLESQIDQLRKEKSDLMASLGMANEPLRALAKKHKDITVPKTKGSCNCEAGCYKCNNFRD